MAALNETFDATQVDPNDASGFRIVPDGKYMVVLEKTELNEANNGSALFFKAQANIVDGPYANQKLFISCTLKHANSDAQRIGKAQFSQLCHAIGKLQVKDTDELLLIPFVARVVVVNEYSALKVKVDSGKATQKQIDRFNYLEAGGYKNDQSEVREFLPASGRPINSTSTQPSATAAPAAPAAPAPQAGQPAAPVPAASTTAAPPAAGGGARRPSWANKGGAQAQQGAQA